MGGHEQYYFLENTIDLEKEEIQLPRIQINLFSTVNVHLS